MLLVTGASGYLGRAILPVLAQHGHYIRTTTRVSSVTPSQSVAVLDMTTEVPLPIALFEGVSCVIHCGGVAHRRAAEAEYQHINVAATLRLAEAAAIAGVSHFIFLSSMNVVPADADSPDAFAAMWSEPSDPYTASKWSAERELTQLLRYTECELTIVRPGLVYDVELTANLARLRRLLTRYPITLPALGCRTMVSRLDLARLLAEIVSGRCGVMAGQPILVASDGERYDAARIGRALIPVGVRVSVPASLLRIVGFVVDWQNGLSAGSTWQGLSDRRWCGPVPTIPGWEPRMSLESCLGQRAD